MPYWRFQCFGVAGEDLVGALLGGVPENAQNRRQHPTLFRAAQIGVVGVSLLPTPGALSPTASTPPPRREHHHRFTVLTPLSERERGGAVEGSVERA